MKKNKSRTKVRFKCADCGSTVLRSIIEGVVIEHCSNDLLPEFSQYFHWFQKQEGLTKVSLMRDWDDTKHSLYGQWYISTQDHTQPFECTWRIDPRAKLFSPSKCVMQIPDPAQQMIAQWILKRELTPQEYWGQHRVPMLTEDGAPSEGHIELVKIPTEVQVKYKDLVDKTTYELMPVLFKKEDL